MKLIIGFIIQLAGFYILYSTSARAVFKKRKHQYFLRRHSKRSKAVGWFMLLTSCIAVVFSLGFGTGLLFSLTSFMVISGYIIILLPLKNYRTQRN